MASTTAINPDTLVTLKVDMEGTSRRHKLPLSDLGATTLPDKLRLLLAIPPTSEVILERYSDSAASFVVLDPSNTSVYKQLHRAAKAKLKLRLKVTLKDKKPMIPKPASVEDEVRSPATMGEEYSPPHTRAATPPAGPTQATTSFTEKCKTPTTEMQRGLDGLRINNRCDDAASAAWDNLQKAQSPIRSTFNDFSLGCPYSSPRNAILEPCPTALRDKWFAELGVVSREHPLSRCAPPLPASSIFTVYCNNCNDSLPEAHYHCGTCEDGDFDLCQKCVDVGVSCGGKDHWMIKRTVEDGRVINSTTETLPPKVPKAVVSNSKISLVTPEANIVKLAVASRTCNSCMQQLPEENFVTCLNCEDFDLCIFCHISMQHGHHPQHEFAPAVKGLRLGPLAKALLAPGRNVGHNAVCDGCDKYIYGVRHKCLDCPDWDFCGTCILDATYIHPGHRFVPIYESLNDVGALSTSFSSKARHHGIYCDGPMCNSEGRPSYIKGDRYKCAVCNDTDFCGSCEASPTNPHNKTHPLIKFKTAVRNCSVTTMGGHETGQNLPVMGDYRGRTTSRATETALSPSTNAATQVQTIAHLQPTEPPKKEETETKEETIAEIKVEKTFEVSSESASLKKPELVAHFVRDAVPDGSLLPPSHVFEQTWYLRNGGESAWPAGCSVKFVGGDNMCAVDPKHPASIHELVSAAESTTCYTEVAPGQEVGFTVLMRTPSRRGNFISYWRLSMPDGGKFGHRLWCDVSVIDSVRDYGLIKKGEPNGVTKTEGKVEPDGGQMIFHKLEKESPTSSIHQNASSSAADTRSVPDHGEEFVDELLDDDETEDGFMTDEEYDILDASDEGYPAAQVNK